MLPFILFFTGFGLFLVFVPRKMFELEGIGYVKQLRVFSITLGIIMFVLGVVLALKKYG